MMLPLGDASQRVLDDDDRTIDDQTEVERAEAHQVCGNPALQHAETGHQHRDRDHQSCDQCCPEVAEQQEQHDDDQQRAFGQVLGDGFDRRIDERRPVEHRLNCDVLRKRCVDLH